MATLTYNPEEPQEGEFTPEEQESLAVGEQLAQEQEALLAGKFKDAEELEKAYVELQSKLGKSKEEPKEEVQEEQQQEQVSNDFFETVWNEASQDKFSKETVEKLKGMNPGDYLKMYLDYRNGVESNAQANTITQEDATSLQQMVGGEDSYKQMVNWASDNFNEQEINMYDDVMASGNAAAMFFAVQALKSRYTDGVGQDGQLITGKPASTKSTGFRSQAEVVRAMSDPRYDTDPAYRQDVFEKLDRSNIEF